MNTLPELGAWPRGVCSNGVTTNSHHFTPCMKSEEGPYMRCSGVKCKHGIEKRSSAGTEMAEERMVLSGDKCDKATGPEMKLEMPIG